MTRVAWAAAPLLCASLWLATGAARADLAVTANAPATPTLRSVLANATVGANASMNTALESKTGGGFNQSQPANETDGNGGSAVSVTANQDSSIPNLTGPTMSGMGMVEVTWNPGVAQAASVDSFFDVFFSVDATAQYVLSGRLTNSTNVLSGITTLFARLLNKTGGTSLADHSAAGPFSDTVMLETGNTYELKLDANIDGNLAAVMATTIEDASWQFTLAPVSEPSTLALAGTGVLGLTGWYAGRRWRDRRRQPPRRERGSVATHP
jgi:hypothetical protein